MKNIEVGQVWVLASSIQAVVERVFTEHWQPDCRVRLLHSSGLLSVMRSQLRFLVREADGGPPWIKSPGYCPAFDDTLDYDLWMGDGDVLNADAAADSYDWSPAVIDPACRIDAYRVRPKRWEDKPGAPVSEEHLLALGMLPSTTKPVDAQKAPEVSDNADAIQVGGSHYKDMPIQPWTVMQQVLTRDEFVGFLKGNIIRYSMRAGHKQGTDDVAKAEHYAQKLREVQGGGHAG